MNDVLSRRNFLLGAAGAASMLVLPQAAEAATWVRLGTSRVNGLADFDRVSVSASAGQFRRIRLRVRGNSLLMYRMVVQYANGRRDDIPVRSVIRQGGYTRAIDLNGARRNIRSVSFYYGKLPNGAGPTFVDLYGIR